MNLSPKNLVRLQEECAEVIHMICKIQRFGPESTKPKGGATSKERLLQECADVLVCIEALGFDSKDLQDAMLAKERKLIMYATKEII